MVDHYIISVVNITAVVVVLAFVIMSLVLDEISLVVGVIFPVSCRSRFST